MTSVETHIEDTLSHFGKKGMKWGQRKAKTTASATTNNALPKVNSKDIVRARARVTLEGKKATPLDKITADRQTRGEAILTVMLAGPIGAAIVVGNDASQNRKQRNLSKK